MGIKITLVQFKPIFLNLEKNIEKALSIINKIDEGIILFPELFLSGYTFSSKKEVKSNSLNLNSKLLEPFFRTTMKKDIAICGGYAEQFNDKFYNSSFFIANGKVLNNYRKTHLFFHEKDFFSPGNTGFNVFEYKNYKFGMMICFDWIFPEAARTLALKGAQVILHPANLVLPYCQKAMFARTIENRVFIATANRIGEEKNGDYQNNFTGQSQIVNPKGEYILTFTNTEETFKTIEINPDDANNKNITDLNNIFSDLRPEFYKQK